MDAGLRVDSPVTPGVGGLALAKPGNCTGSGRHGQPAGRAPACAAWI